MPRADFEPTEVIQPNTFEISNNPGANALQANVTYFANVLDENSVLGAGGETGAVVKYGRDHRQENDRLADAESPRLYNNPGDAEHGLHDRHMLTRAVAASEMDKMIGLNVVAEEKFGVDEHGETFGASVFADGAGIQSEFRVNPGEDKKVCFLAANYRDPAIQKGLSDLEVSDYLSGQMDRHAGNIFVDPDTGKVTGIDNDLAFPEVDRETLIQREAFSYGATDNKAVAGFPRQMHQDTKAKILATSSAELREKLSAITPPGSTEEMPGRLTEAEINGACRRLEALQEELRSPNCSIQVVAQFDDNTYEAAVNAQKDAFENVAWKGGPQTWDNCQDGNLFDKAPKTSYLGAVALKEKMIATNIAVMQQENAQLVAQGQEPQVIPAAMRDPRTAPKAPRNEQYAEYAKQAEIAKQTLKANPQLIEDPGARQQVMGIKEQMSEVKAKIAHYDKETAKLEEGKLGAKLRSLASGGTEGRKEFYAEKKLAAQQQLATLERQLDAAAAEAVPLEMKAGLMADAGAVIEARAQQNNVAQAQNGVAAQQANHEFLNHPAPQPPNVAELADNAVQQAGNAVQQPNLEFLNHPAPQPPNVPQVQNNAVPQNGAPKAAELPKAAEDELDVAELDEVDELDEEVEVEVKQEGHEKGPSVGEMLKRANSSPALGGHRQAQGQGQGGPAQNGPKPGGNSLRASGQWQAAKPSAPKPGGSSLSASH